MNEGQAWACFAQSGRVEDYIRYAQIRNGGVPPEGGLEVAHKNPDPGAY